MSCNSQIKYRLGSDLTRQDKINVKQALIHYFLDVDVDGLGKLLNIQIVKLILPFLKKLSPVWKGMSARELNTASTAAFSLHKTISQSLKSILRLKHGKASELLFEEENQGLSQFTDIKDFKKLKQVDKDQILRKRRQNLKKTQELGFITQDIDSKCRLVSKKQKGLKKNVRNQYFQNCNELEELTIGHKFLPIKAPIFDKTEKFKVENTYFTKKQATLGFAITPLGFVSEQSE